MDENNRGLSETLSEQPAAGRTPRLFFIDHLRAALIILVVLHHVAIVYGAGSTFYYMEPPFNDPLAYIVLLVFVLCNQAWFMGALFLIAGYFTPGSFDRKGSGAFLKERLIRLGIPLIIFYFILNPVSSTGYWQMPSYLTGISDPLTWAAYPYLLGMGPLWFVALLLIFDFGYAAWRALARKRTSPSEIKSSQPTYLGIGSYILALALASYLLRIIVPIGKEIFDFPTLAYLPQYLSLFIVGIVAFRRNWFETISGGMGAVGFATATAATVFLFPLAVSGSLFSIEITGPEDFIFVGNGHWQSAVYALWDSITAVGMSLAALTFFRRFFYKENRFGAFLSQQSYAVYIIHTPIIVFAAVALKGIDFEPLLKFGVVALIVIPVCFAVAYVIRKIPGVSRVL